MALVERGPLGGTCINRLLAHQDHHRQRAAAHLARRGADFDVQTAGHRLSARHGAQGRIVRRFRSGSKNACKTTRATTSTTRALRGTAPRPRRRSRARASASSTWTRCRPADSGTVRPTPPSGLTTLPAHLVIIGGGYIRLNTPRRSSVSAAVTIVERAADQGAKIAASRTKTQDFRGIAPARHRNPARSAAPVGSRSPSVRRCQRSRVAPAGRGARPNRTAQPEAAG